jgi:hypothetical protein
MTAKNALIRGMRRKREARTTVMQGPKDKPTLVKLPKSHALVIHAAAAIHSVSIAEGRPVTMRETAICGFEKLIEDSRMDVIITLKFFQKYDFSGPKELFAAFKPEEMISHQECRKRLAALSMEPIGRADTVILALIRMGRPEFGFSPLMDVRELEGKMSPVAR